MLQSLTNGALTAYLDAFFEGTHAFAIAAFLQRLTNCALVTALDAFFDSALAVAITVFLDADLEGYRRTFLERLMNVTLTATLAFAILR